MKLLQLNVLHGGEIFDNLIEFLRTENADVLHLQEVYTNTQTPFDPHHPNFSLFEYIQEHFDYQYSAFSKTFDIQAKNDLNIPMGNATFSRYPILNFHNSYIPNNEGFAYEHYAQKNPKDFSHSPANFLTCEIEINGKKVTSVNMHGVWGFDGEDNPRRLQMRDMVLDAIKDKEYVMVSGDFNTSPHTETMQGIGNVVHNVFEGELLRTFNLKRWRKSDNADFVVDHMFFSHNIEVLSHYQPQVDVSDHLPLVAELHI